MTVVREISTSSFYVGSSRLTIQLVGLQMQNIPRCPNIY